MRNDRALEIAPTIATISLPPKHLKTSIGVSKALLFIFKPSRTTFDLRINPASSTPVPRPTHSSGSPPYKPQATAAAEVVLPIPISPTTSKSASISIEFHPTNIAF